MVQKHFQNPELQKYNGIIYARVIVSNTDIGRHSEGIFFHNLYCSCTWFHP